MQNYKVILENSLVVSCKAVHALIIGFSYSTAFSREMKMCLYEE